VADEKSAACAREFGSGELIELILTASFYVMVPRVLDAIAVTAEGEPSDQPPGIG
jgi:hypothetical protein